MNAAKVFWFAGLVLLSAALHAQSGSPFKSDDQATDVSEQQSDEPDQATEPSTAQTDNQTQTPQAPASTRRQAPGGVFKPSEEISEDRPVAFPVDI